MKSSLHRTIRTDIERNIHCGDWPPGYRIPPEYELQTQYDCSRATVNKALSYLAAAGLVERRKKAGTFVAAPRAHSAVLTIPDIAEVIRAQGKTYRFQTLSRDTRPLDMTNVDEQELAVACTVMALTGLHLRGGQPFALEERVVNLDLVPDAKDADFTAKGPGAWLLRHIPWTKGKHTISAMACDDHQAELLKLTPGDACLQLSRWTWREGKGVTFVRQIFPADYLELTAEFTPNRFG